MKIVVAIRQGLDGDISPFDAAAYEAALRIKGAEITLLSMGPLRTEELLLRLSRLGASDALLLSDPKFAGADTLATAYTLSLAVRQLKPDLVFCGRQTLIGDTAQTPPMLAAMADIPYCGEVMSVDAVEADGIRVTTRKGECRTLTTPALLSFERIYTLRLPSLRSRQGNVRVADSIALGADSSRIGLTGSPTRVVETRENTSGKRKCKFIEMSKLPSAIELALKRETELADFGAVSGARLPHVIAVGDAPEEYARSVSDNVTRLPLSDPDTLISSLKSLDADAVLFPSSADGRELAAVVAARLSLGLCADCTSLDTDGKELFMIRPAQAGSVMARVRSLTRPALATVRCTDAASSRIIVAAGYGARNDMDKVTALKDALSAELCASRKAVDNDILPYSSQVGLTGRSLSPTLYIAVGISGAVHHIVGMQYSGTVIAINPDRAAPIFEYADFGIIDSAENLKL